MPLTKIIDFLLPMLKYDPNERISANILKNELFLFEK